MFKLGITLLAMSGIIAAQGVDFGALAGAGGFRASGPTVAARQVGVEAWDLCNGRLGVFGEYSHWFTSGQAQGFNASASHTLVGVICTGLSVAASVSATPEK